jgi:alkylhydroperoxidase family enzyme
MSRALGIGDEELSTLSRYRAAGIFDDLEVLIMDLAVAMTSTPAHVPDELRTALESRVGRAAYAEITATVAWENHRARLNRALGVRESRVLRRSILYKTSFRSVARGNVNNVPERVAQ